MSIQKGQSAPDFKLFNSDKKEVGLQDYKGKNLVILFFPQAFTGVCTTELCSVRDNLNIYTSLNAEVVGVSVDSIFTLAKSAAVVRPHADDRAFARAALLLHVIDDVFEELRV